MIKIESENLKKYVKLIGKALSFVAVILLIVKLVQMDVDYSILKDRRNILYFAVFVLIQTFVNLTGCIPWLHYVEVLGEKKLRYFEVQVVYLKANILKYVPGNVFQYIGRNELAINCGIGHADVALATVLDVVTMIFTSLLISCVLISEQVAGYIGSSLGELGIYALVFVAICVAGIMFLRRMNNRIGRYIRKCMGVLCTSRGIAKAVYSVVYYVVIDGVGPVMFYVMLTQVLGTSIDLKQFYVLAGVYLFSFVAGFVTPGASGGIGIREMVMIVLAGNIIPEDTILLAVVLLRIISVASDFISFLYAKVAEKIFDVGKETR